MLSSSLEQEKADEAFGYKAGLFLPLRQRNNRMNTINEITATYQRIAEEGRSELNKVQNKIYRIGSLRLLLFVAGIAGIIYFWSSGWIVLTGIIAVTLLPFILLIKYHNRLFQRKTIWKKDCNQ